MSLPISAVIIVKDGEAHLAEVLTALSPCAEILVLDSGSTDRTLAIAQAAGVRIEHQAFLGYGPQKNRAIDLARHDWILSIDADEILDEAGRQALARLDLSDPSRCWRLRRRTFVGSTELRHGHLNDAPLRLFNRGMTRFGDVPVHESVTPRGTVATLDGSLAHFAFRDAADLVARGAGYARLKAARYQAHGRSASAVSLLMRAAAAFAKSYVLKAGFLDGRLGVVSALSAALNATTALAMTPPASPATSPAR
jgi:glycosyltransferase involved in cell wall biosynthesis